jgi:hypothetical protein
MKFAFTKATSKVLSHEILAFFFIKYLHIINSLTFLQNYVTICNKQSSVGQGTEKKKSRTDTDVLE